MYLGCKILFDFNKLKKALYTVWQKFSLHINKIKKVIMMFYLLIIRRQFASTAEVLLQITKREHLFKHCNKVALDITFFYIR